MYRDKITFEGALIRCRVYVMSVATAGRDLGQADKTNVIVSFRPTANLDGMFSTKKFTWRGKEYTVKNAPVPIMALGGLDHYEVHAERVTG